MVHTLAHEKLLMIKNAAYMTKKVFFGISYTFCFRIFLLIYQ